MRAYASRVSTEASFYHLLAVAQKEKWGKRKFRCKNRLYRMDATIIESRLSMVDCSSNHSLFATSLTSPKISCRIGRS